jgi:hypothetical protein
MGAAAAPMLIGSAIGAFTNKDPLKGALLGGFMGAAGGALMPTLGGLGSTAANTAATAGTTAAGANIPAGAAFINPAGVNAATAAATGPSAILGVEAAKSAGSGIFSAPRAVNTAITPSFERPLTLGMPNVEPGQGYQYTLGDRFSQIGQFAQQNPVLTQMASQTGQSLLQQPERPLPAPGLLRGSQIPMEAAQYDVGIPKVSLI